MASSQKLRRVSDGHSVVVDPFGGGRTFREYCQDMATRGPKRVVVVYIPAGAGAWLELVCGHWRFLATAPRTEPQLVECRLCAALLKSERSSR